LLINYNRCPKYFHLSFGKKHFENIMLEAATGKIDRDKIEQIFRT